MTLVNKYLRGKIMSNQSDAYRNFANQRSFYKTKILLHHCAIQCAVPKIVRTTCPNWTAKSRTSGTIFGLCPRADTKLNPCTVCDQVPPPVSLDILAIFVKVLIYSLKMSLSYSIW